MDSLLCSSVQNLVSLALGACPSWPPHATSMVRRRFFVSRAKVAKVSVVEYELQVDRQALVPAPPPPPPTVAGAAECPRMEFLV